MKRIYLLLAALGILFGAKAETIPSGYYSTPEAGSFYLYNVSQGKFLERLNNNFPGLSTSPAEVTVAQSGNSYTIQFADGKYLKTGYWNNQYLWTDGTAGASETLWDFVPIAGETNVYQLRRTATETWGDATGIFYANGTNAATSSTDDCRWALVDRDAYDDMAMENSIPAKYRSEIPTATGDYYLFDVLNQKFLNTSNCTLSDSPSNPATITPSGSSFLIAGATGKYLKIGVYKGQYLWSDGDATSTKWIICPEAGKEAEKVYYIYSNDFTETNAEVSGKTMYLTGTNASEAKPSRARWALLTEADYVAFLASGEGGVDAGAVAANKSVMTEAKGDATSLLQNPTFERSADGWWGGTRTLNQLYRGSGYAYESDADGTVLLQTIKHMPAGTYKVVAAVRGTQGTAVTARVADAAGATVTNRGSHSVDSQINMNGVKMPYSTLGGFNDSDNAQGWTWATATGTLSEDGHLKVEFQQTGAGTVSVADVHLYYMSSGSTQYAVEYSDGVDAINHAVACDLQTDNPNRLFTSTGTITTISGAALANNLVGGAVSNLTLWDGHDFTASTDFIANKATYYCDIPTGTVKAICLPFAISSTSAGTFYEPKSLSGTTLHLKEVGKPEAGKAYLYQGKTDIQTLTGSGNVKVEPVKAMAVGTFTAMSDAPKGCYVVSGNNLSRAGNHATVDAFSAYFVVESEASKLTLNFDETDEDAIWKKPQVTISTLDAGQECYLYNVEAKRFYTEGNAYGTQASVGDTGLKVKFVQNGDAVKLTNYSEAAKAWRTMFVTTNGAMFTDGESVTECNWQVVKGAGDTFKLMITSPNESYHQASYPGAMMGLDLFENDLHTNLAALLFADEEPGEGLYLTDWAVVTAVDYDSYQQAVATYKAALQLKDLLDEAAATSIDTDNETAIYENTQSTLDQLTEAITSITNKLIEGELNGVSWDTPIDLTDKFVTNPRYENNDNEGWSGTASGIDAANNLQNAEFFNTNFDCYQDLVGLPEGYYRLSLEGFYRAGLEGPALEAKQNGTEDQVMNAELYATTDGQTTTTKMQSIFTGAPQTALGVSGEIHNGSWWVPNNMASAAAYFAAGYYHGNNLVVHVTNGQLRIGLRKSTTIRRDWVMLDNWKLEYLGKSEK